MEEGDLKQENRKMIVWQAQGSKCLISFVFHLPKDKKKDKKEKEDTKIRKEGKGEMMPLCLRFVLVSFFY